MSEEILKALTQLFAIITKQDGGVTENERGFVLNFFQQELDQSSIDEYIRLYDEFSGYGKEEERNKLTSVRDSVKTLGICKKINKTLTQKQKVVVLIKLLELIGSDRNFTPQRLEIINTVSTVFNITQDEYKLIESFIMQEKVTDLDHTDILLACLDTTQHAHQRHLHVHVEGYLVFMRISSVDMYFVRYQGPESNTLNGFPMSEHRVYLFSHGSTVKTQTGDVVYYSDLVANFNEELRMARLSFNATIPEIRFPNGAIGLRPLRISEGPGKLIGIMGASGAGKTTLLNVLAGLEQPAQGRIFINGIDVIAQREKVQGAIGYVSQDDLLIEELTVYQNLYYNAKLCFSQFSEEQLHERVMVTLESLGLEQRKDLRVGNALEKVISGGQRKRLNIALELIREPAVLFLDEPTSGLSSRDSENVIDLLKELSLKGKLVFAVIHQPSSDIYKMFDKMIIMDTGGYLAYYGPPVEAVTYFKRSTHQVDSNRGQCMVCGNVNPEQIFNIIEAKVVDEYGQPTAKRKVTPVQWGELYQNSFKSARVEDVNELPAHSLSLPGRLKQTVIFATRDWLSKLANRQYLLINLLEAPLLAFILAFIIRYRNSPGASTYVFRYNDNFPAYMLMAIIVALFMGLTVSAEEIIRDRKILKRESFLNLSWNSYLMSKLSILFSLSAVQTLSFVVIGNSILEIDGVTFSFWLVLFSTACFANVLGLNISSAFNSAVTVYVMIPLLLIPQMILSGLLFKFEKLNNLISTKGKVPVVADLMASRWAYEAMAVDQFIHNQYNEPFYSFDRDASISDFHSAYLIPELRARNQYVLDHLKSDDDSVKRTVRQDLEMIRAHLAAESYRKGMEGVDPAQLTMQTYTPELGRRFQLYLDDLTAHYQQLYNQQVSTRDKKMAFFEKRGHNLNAEKDAYYNESLADLVRNTSVKDRLIAYRGKLIQQHDPIYQRVIPAGWWDYRAPFFAPEKHLAGLTLETYTFNIGVIWLMAAGCYLALYGEWLRKFVNMFSKVNFPVKRA
ncbi:MAG: ATP-binding cassette domain-containing protein [Cyclobacteriaceae bacterium]|nr:ATP-binding cassette domain-containing protein [Cyclobacteriaceae bacterium]